MPLDVIRQDARPAASRAEDDGDFPRLRLVGEGLLLCSLFAYLTWFRVHGLQEDFFLMGDQMRDWNVALRRLQDLPLSGVPSVAGGTTLGPAYYWILWLLARVVGPATENLPHAGGIGISLLQGYADVVLAWALARRLNSLAAASAIVLLSASSVNDAVFSSTIWNPPVAVALVKLTLALVLVDTGRSVRAAMGTAFTGWVAVQCHTTAIIASVPLLAWTVLAPSGAGAWRDVARRAGVVLVVVAILQVPWFLARPSANATQSSRIVDSVEQTLASPASRLRPAASATALRDHTNTILMAPYPVPHFGWLLAAGSLALIALSRNLVAVIAGPAVLMTAMGAYAIWQGTYELYWYLPIVPSAAIASLAWLAYLPRAIGAGAIAGLLLAVIAAQPARFERVRTTAAYPGYGAMVRGCRQIIEQGRPVSAIKMRDLMQAVEPIWVCSILGATLDADAAEIATIDATGAVLYTSATPALPGHATADTTRP